MGGSSEWMEVRRGARPRRGSQQQQPTVVFNQFSALQQEYEMTDEIAPWRTRPEQRERVHRVLRELRWHRVVTGSNMQRPADDILTADTAEAVKAFLASDVPEYTSGLADPTATLAPLWNRISLTRLRMQGAKVWFATVRTLDGKHRLLVLKVPPKHTVSEAARWDHAERQCTYRDDEHGCFKPGRRVDWARWHADALPEDRAWLQLMHTGGGAPLSLTGMPAPYFRGDNYLSYDEHPERAAQDFEEMLQRGVLEGPLHYRPHVVNPMGAIYSAEKDKFRTIHDATASGLNDMVLPDECRYDMLEDALPLQTEACWQAGWDLSNAFFHQHRTQHHCDLLGVYRAGQFYRFRYSPFGVADCPVIQQRFSNILKKTANHQGKRRGAQGWPDVNTTAVFMDDGHDTIPAEVSYQDAAAQFARKLDYFKELGIEESKKKRILPTKTKSYTGFLVDSVKQSVTAEVAKQDKYAKELADLAASRTPDGEVNRRALSRVIGKYQHLTPVVQGGQQLLTAAYRSRDQAPPHLSVPLDWGDSTNVVVSDKALRDLEELRDLLRHAHRRYYLDGLPSENGFFTGHTETCIDELLRTYTAHADIPVFVTDASGIAGGGHRLHDRFTKAYPKELCAPCTSSNYREFDTGIEGMLRYQAQEGWEGQRVLWLTDNTTAMSIVNREGTMAPNLEDLSRHLQAHLRSHQNNLKAGHLRGEWNDLADALSRYLWTRSSADWMLLEQAFLAAQQLAGSDFTLDGAADPVGSNAHLPRFCSEVDSFFARDLRGEHVYANPDFKLIPDYIRHFKSEQQRSPHDTSLTLVLPVWLTASWWRLLKGAHILSYYPEGSKLFTSPEWRTQSPGTPPSERVCRGPTRWPTMIVRFPPRMHCRSNVGAASSVRDRAPAAAARGANGAVRVLRGDPVTDAIVLRAVHPSSLW